MLFEGGAGFGVGEVAHWREGFWDGHDGAVCSGAGAMLVVVMIGVLELLAVEGGVGLWTAGIRGLDRMGWWRDRADDGTGEVMGGRHEDNGVVCPLWLVVVHGVCCREPWNGMRFLVLRPRGS